MRRVRKDTTVSAPSEMFVHVVQHKGASLSPTFQEKQSVKE